MTDFIQNTFPAINASLNAIATMLLLVGFVAIKGGREKTHRNLMLSAFAVSCVFLICYLVYHAVAGHVPFGGTGSVRYVYFFILITHIILAAAVPVLAIASIWFGLKDNRTAHRKVAKWAFPIWFYVSITGVVIYVMLYHAYRSPKPLHESEPKPKLIVQQPAPEPATP